MSDDDSLTPNPWQGLRALTAARIALGRVGTSLPTAPHLTFQLDHARARKAVHHPLDVPALMARLQAWRDRAWADPAARGPAPALIALASAAEGRAQYLQRPDLGRRLSQAARAALAEQTGLAATQPDLVVVIGDGLSALAIEENALGFLDALLPFLREAGLRIGALVVVEQARVAVADEIGALLGAQSVVMLIGERPGLSSPDSMGIYFTHAPRPGLTDESRNCISNVRAAGLPWQEAAHRLNFLLTEGRRRKLSGVQLKDETVTLSGPGPGSAAFLLGD